MPLVYQATNQVNGKRYIGATVRILSDRRAAHFVDARSGSQLVFHRAINKYGPKNFLWEVLEEHDTKSAAFDAEVRLIAALLPEYNMTRGGEGTGGFSWTAASRAKLGASVKGRILSQETRRRIGVSHKGITHGPEARAKIGAASKGRVYSAEARAKISAGLMGRKVSPDTRAKIGASHKGRKQSPEAIAKTSAANRGRKQTADEIAKRAASLRGRVFTAEHCAKIADAKRGHPVSEETRNKLSLAHKGKPKHALRGLKRSNETREKLRQSGVRRLDEWRSRSHLGPAASSRQVECLDDGEVYPSASAAAKAYGVAKSALIELCLGQRGRRTVGGLRFRYCEASNVAA